jgi:hypothetical protein
MSLAAPLRKRTLQGATYQRSPHIESLLDELAQLPRSELLERCQITDRNAPDYVPSECLMYEAV